MSSYKQLSNQGTLLLCTGASESADKRRPISQSCNQHRTKSPLPPLTTAAHHRSPLPEGRAGAGGAEAGGAREGGAAGSQSFSAKGLLFNALVFFTQPHASKL